MVTQYMVELCWLSLGCGLIKVWYQEWGLGSKDSGLWRMRYNFLKRIMEYVYNIIRKWHKVVGGVWPK